MNERAYTDDAIRHLYAAITENAVRTIEQDSYPSHADEAAEWLLVTGILLMAKLEINPNPAKVRDWVRLRMAQRDYARTVATILRQVDGQIQEFTDGIQA